LRFIYKYPVLTKVIIILFLILLFFILLAHRTLIPIFFSLAEVEAVRIANRAINSAIDQEIENIKYEDLVTYVMDDRGNIVLMQPNVREINRFSSSIALNIQDQLELIKKSNVSIPIARVFGFDLLAGLGPTLNAKIVPVGFVNPPHIIDSFESAGINQTRHKIYFKVDIRLKLIIPFSSHDTIINADVPVIEVTILGRVPEVYVGLNGDDISGILNR